MRYDIDAPNAALAAAGSNTRLSHDGDYVRAEIPALGRSIVVDPDDSVLARHQLRRAAKGRRDYLQSIIVEAQAELDAGLAEWEILQSVFNMGALPAEEPPAAAYNSQADYDAEHGD